MRTDRIIAICAHPPRERSRKRRADRHDRQRVEDRIGDHLQNDIPIAGELEDRQSHEAGEKDHVLVVSGEQFGEFEISLQIGPQQSGRDSVPLISEGH